MNNKNILFVLGEGIYPYKCGGMEIFNFYLAKQIRNKYKLNCLSYKPFSFTNVNWYRLYSIKPRKIFDSVQFFFHCLIHPTHKTVMLTYGGKHWISVFIDTLVIKCFHLKSIAVIHYGKAVKLDSPIVDKHFFKAQFCVVAVSEDIKKNYDKAFDINCRVIPPLVPFERVKSSKNELRNKYGIPINSNVICMIGTIKQMKNPDTLIKGLAKMTSFELELYSPYAIYAGNGPMIDSLRALAKELGIENRVKFLGNVPKEVVGEVYKLSDIYLIASDFEGTSVSLLEAMYNKMPIITSRVPGIIDMVRENTDAIMYEVKNEVQLKNRIVQLIQDPQLRIKLQESAYRQYENKYNYASMLSQYIELFE